MTLYINPLAEWRISFLTASTWAGCTATATELAYALSHYRDGQSPDAAVAVLKHRRALEQRGKLRREDVAERDSDGPVNTYKRY